jgi:hypothetical protein
MVSIMIPIQPPMHYMTVDIIFNNRILPYILQLVIILRCIRANCSLVLKSHIFTLLHGAGNGSVKVDILFISLNVICSRHDIDENNYLTLHKSQLFSSIKIPYFYFITWCWQWFCKRNLIKLLECFVVN